MEEKIIYTALDNLKKHIGIDGHFTAANTRKDMDGKIDMIFEDGKEVFLVEVKKEIRNYQLPQIADTANKVKNFMLVAETIFPKIKDALRKKGIGYLDAAGNIFLQTAAHNIWIEGQKQKKTAHEKINRAFTATGLKAVYLFLLRNDFVNHPQRSIAEEAAIGLGNVNYVLNGLKEHGFLIEKNGREFQLINKNELLQKWANGFEDKLKPALHIGNFRFLNRDEQDNWKHLQLKPHHTFWGGEPAGGIITNYLMPEIFTLYTEEARADLIKNYRLVPDPNGNIKVYKKFWRDKAGFNETTVHPILAYTDLLNTGDNRCEETAKMIYDKYIKENI